MSRSTDPHFFSIRRYSGWLDWNIAHIDVWDEYPLPANWVIIPGANP